MPAAIAMPAAQRRLITTTGMLCSILQTLDNTIANVALPRMQGSLSATQDQMSWVLTSYIIAAAITTPLTGWLAGRFGRRRLFLASIAGFTLASMLCGLAQSLPQIVLFRFLQGMAGASLVPMSQAVLFDINPPERHGKAMAAWGQGVLLGPMLGPIVGGWLTDHYSWRWVFYINLPLGILAFLGVLACMPQGEARRTRFDFLGFALLGVAITGLQLVLDRGPIKDWFGSGEIQVEAVVTGLALYLFAVHTATAREPFIRPSLFQDRNFLTGNVLAFLVGVVIFATLSLLPSLLQNLLGYPVLGAGLLTSPRSLGSLAAMLVVGHLVGRIDSRLIIATGFGLAALSLWQMTRFSLGMDGTPVFWSGVFQGFGVGIAYVPMAALAFATLAPELRNEGTALFSLIRNIGSSVGIALVQALLSRNMQVVHASLAAHITPYNLASRDPALAAQIAAPQARALFDAGLSRQATMIAYLDDFKLMLLLILLAIPLLLLVRPVRPAVAKEEAAYAAVE